MSDLRPSLAIVSSLYRAEDHYPRFVPAVIATLRAAAAKGLSCECILVVNEPASADRAAVARIQSAADEANLHGSIRPLFVPRETLYASWNRGVRHARADAITFWNADDARDAGALVEGVRRIRSGAKLVHFDWIIESYDRKKKTDVRRRVVSPLFDPFLYARLMWFGPFFMFSRDLYEAVGPFDEQFQVAGDLDWCVRALRVAGRIEKADLAEGIFSDRKAGLSTSLPRRAAREARWIRLRYQQWDFLPLWDRRKAGDFRCDSLRDSEAAAGWRHIPRRLREPTIPSPYSIDWFRKRGRPVYQLWTRLMWLLFPCYNLEKLRKRLSAGERGP